jgi:hypothetical protein
MVALSNPFQRGSRGWGVFIYGNHATRRGNGTSWWGCLCDVCFASRKSSEREFFVPARTHLGVKLLILVVSHCLSIAYFYPFLKKYAHVYLRTHD